jgi:hypothetical protein
MQNSAPLHSTAQVTAWIQGLRDAASRLLRPGMTIAMGVSANPQRCADFIEMNGESLALLRGTSSSATLARS